MRLVWPWGCACLVAGGCALGGRSQPPERFARVTLADPSEANVHALVDTLPWEAGIPFEDQHSNGLYYVVPARDALRAIRLLRAHGGLPPFVHGAARTVPFLP